MKKLFKVSAVLIALATVLNPAVAGAEVGVGDDTGTRVKLHASIPASVRLASGLSFIAGAASTANGVHGLPYRGTVAVGVEYLKTRRMIGGKPVIKVPIAGTAAIDGTVSVPLTKAVVAKLRAVSKSAHRGDALVRIDFEYPLVNLAVPSLSKPTNPWTVCTTQVWARVPIS